MRAQEFISEISDEQLQRYLDRAGSKVDRRMTRMAQARDRLNKGYEIYHAETPNKVVHRFEANTPQEAKRYFDRYNANYESDVDYDLRLRRATGIIESEEDLNELALKSTLPVTQTMNHPAKQVYDMKTQSGEYKIVFHISNKDFNTDDEPDYDGPTGYLLDMAFLGRTPDGSWTQWNTNVGEKEVAKIYSTVAQLAVKIIKAHPEIDEIDIKGADPQRSRIYSRLMQQNIDSLLPGWKLGGEGLVREKSQPALAEAFDQPYPIRWETGEYGAYDAHRVDENFANLREIVKMPPTKNSSQGMADWAYKDALDKKATLKGSLKGIPSKVYDMGDHLRVFVLDDQGPVLYLALDKFLDGFKSGAVAVDPRGRGQNLAVRVYQAASDTFGRPIYSDTTQTDASRIGIWQKLISAFPDRVVGYDQKTREDLPLTHTDQGPIVRNNQPIYVQRTAKDQPKPMTGQNRSRTRLLKLLPSINENFADGKKPGRKGLSRRVGIPKKATLGQLEKIAKSSTGEKRRMAQWQLNMRRGKKNK